MPALALKHNINKIMLPQKAPKASYTFTFLLHSWTRTLLRLNSCQHPVNSTKSFIPVPQKTGKITREIKLRTFTENRQLHSQQRAFYYCTTYILKYCGYLQSVHWKI